MDGQPSTTRFQQSAVPGEDDLVLDSGQGSLAAEGLVPQGIVLHVLQHAGDLDAGERFQSWLLGLAGDVGIPDLKRSGDVPPIGTQQPDDVLVDETSLLCEAG